MAMGDTAPRTVLLVLWSSVCAMFLLPFAWRYGVLRLSISVPALSAGMFPGYGVRITAEQKRTCAVFAFVGTAFMLPTMSPSLIAITIT